MAFPFPSSSYSSSSSFIVSQEDFNLFHTIDRQLFTRLAVNLGRDPTESMQVMALWLWFERVGHCRNLVHKLLPLPLTLLNSFADEAVMVLTCIELDEFPANLENIEIAMTLNFARTEISLRFFHGIRVSVLRGVTQIVNEVCSRAFQDILQNLLDNQNPILRAGYNEKSRAEQEYNVNVNNSNVVGGQDQQAAYGPILGLPILGNPSIGFVPHVQGGAGGGFNFNNVPQKVHNAVVCPMDPRAIMETVANAEISRAFDQYDLSHQRHILSNELSELLGNLNFTSIEDDEERDSVPADDRTIFLTFSKGYPISEMEVREFITRRYGDCIDAIFMQEVLSDEQVLYARLVLKSTSAIPVVLGGQNKAKFSINGKHVWARKYVRKQQALCATTSSLSQPASSSSQPVWSPSQPSSPRATTRPS